MKHWFVFFLALASVGSVKGQQTITLSNGNMVAGAYKQPPTRTVKRGQRIFPVGMIGKALAHIRHIE